MLNNELYELKNIEFHLKNKNYLYMMSIFQKTINIHIIFIPIFIKIFLL